MATRPKRSNDITVVILVLGAGLSALATRAAAAPVSIHDAILRLESADPDVRQGAVEMLHDAGDRLTADDGIDILGALGRLLPPFRVTGSVDVDEAMLDLLAEHPSPRFVDPTVRAYRMLTFRGRDAAFGLLQAIDTRQAAAGIVRIVADHARAGDVRELPLWRFQQHPAFGDELFPALLNYMDVPGVADDVCLTFIDYLQHGATSADLLPPHAREILAHCADLNEKLSRQQRADGIAWRYDQTYAPDRERLGVVLDLLGYLRGPGVRETLERAMQLSDPRPKHFAIVSLLRQGADVPADQVAQVAADPEMRNWMYQALVEFHRESLFPARYKTQAAFAESEMVQWLVFPTELGRAPDDIQLMNVLSSETPQGPSDWYVFRFRISGEDWLAGWAGPYLKKDEPTIDGDGGTFSRFEPWDKRTAEGHLADALADARAPAGPPTTRDAR